SEALRARRVQPAHRRGQPRDGLGRGERAHLVQERQGPRDAELAVHPDGVLGADAHAESRRLRVRASAALSVDTIVLDGDMVNFARSFPPALVMVRPAKMTGSGDRVQTRRMCLETDIVNLFIPGVPYTSGPYTMPGMGTLKIEQLH